MNQNRSRSPEGFWDLDFPSGTNTPVDTYKLPPLDSDQLKPKLNRSRKKYLADWNNLSKWCLEMHYKENRHHPEHFKNPEEEMTLEDRMELTCDLLGSVKGRALHRKMKVSLSECRAVIENEKWVNWKYALTEYLPPASKNLRNLPKRWDTFLEEEKDILKELYNRLKAGESEVVIKHELYQTHKLESVAFYKRDLECHRKGVEQMWNEIKGFHTPEMEFRISSHDQDKYKLEMVIGYTSTWCFW